MSEDALKQMIERALAEALSQYRSASADSVLRDAGVLLPADHAPADHAPADHAAPPTPDVPLAQPVKVRQLKKPVKYPKKDPTQQTPALLSPKEAYELAGRPCHINTWYESLKPGGALAHLAIRISPSRIVIPRDRFLREILGQQPQGTPPEDKDA